jgi:outer membrane protein assembly factor BamB
MISPMHSRPFSVYSPLMLIVALSSQHVVAEDWTQFRGPNRDGISRETGLWNSIQSKDPQLVWMADGVGNGYASVSIMKDRLYTTGNSKNNQVLSCVSLKDGKVLWSQPINEANKKHGYPGSRTTPTIDGDRLYAVSSDGAIVCLNARSGQPIWRRDFTEWNGVMMSGWGYSESPLVDDKVVVCTPGGPNGMLVALDKMTGREVWASKFEISSTDVQDGGKGDKKSLKDGAGYASIVISNGGGVKQYVQLVGRGVIGVRASDGEVLWRYSRVANSTANIPNVIADGDNIFCSTGYGTGSALLKLASAGNNKVSMEEVYFLDGKTLQNKHGGMVLVNGHIYCGHGNGTGMPICVDVKTGTIAWGPERGVGSGESSVAYADGHVVFRFQDGKVAIVKATPEKFEVVRSFDPAFQEKESWSHPVITDGRLYLREQNKVMCYQLR